MQREAEVEAIITQTAPAGRRRGTQASPRGPRQGSAAAFRAAVEERLRALEREMAEVKSRVNGLIFLIAGTVATQVILRLIQ
jgi:hypothetical protein